MNAERVDLELKKLDALWPIYVGARNKGRAPLSAAGAGVLKEMVIASLKGEKFSFEGVDIRDINIDFFPRSVEIIVGYVKHSTNLPPDQRWGREAREAMLGVVAEAQSLKRSLERTS